MNTDGEETAICNTEPRGRGESLSSFKSLKVLCVLPLTLRYAAGHSYAKKGSFLFAARTRPVYANTGEQNRMNILGNVSHL